MANAGNEIEQLTSRLARLESQNRWLKLGVLSIAALAGFAVMVGAAPNKEPRIIEAEGFIMRDANGVARVEMGKDGFFINNEDGKHRISIFSGKENGTGIGLFADDTSHFPHICRSFSPNIGAAATRSSTVLIRTDAEPSGNLALQGVQLRDERW